MDFKIRLPIQKGLGTSKTKLKEKKMNFKNLNNFKKNALGLTLTMVEHTWYPTGKIIGKPRKIISVNSNSLQFEGGSSLCFDYGAKTFKFEENKIIVDLCGSTKFEEVMVYEINS